VIQIAIHFIQQQTVTTNIQVFHMLIIQQFSYSMKFSGLLVQEENDVNTLTTFTSFAILLSSSCKHVKSPLCRFPIADRCQH